MNKKRNPISVSAEIGFLSGHFWSPCLIPLWGKPLNWDVRSPKSVNGGILSSYQGCEARLVAALRRSTGYGSLGADHLNKHALVRRLHGTSLLFCSIAEVANFDSLQQYRLPYISFCIAGESSVVSGSRRRRLKHQQCYLGSTAYFPYSGGIGMKRLRLFSPYPALQSGLWFSYLRHRFVLLRIISPWIDSFASLATRLCRSLENSIANFFPHFPSDGKMGGIIVLRS